MKRKLLQILLCVCMAAVLAIAVGAAETETGYLTFSSDSAFTLKVHNYKADQPETNWDGTLEYSVTTPPTEKSWMIWDGKEISSVDGKLYLRGTENTVITGDNTASANRRFVLDGTNIACTGNIETLLDYNKVANDEHPVMGAYCFSFLFYDCDELIEAPELPATTLTEHCYGNMFRLCEKLKKAPALPAETLASNCYDSMFYSCRNLTKAPALPAETLVSGCYLRMFMGCENLKEIPVLPATTLAGACYNSMFRNCESLFLSKNETEDYCYEWSIPAGAIEVDGWNFQMFYNTNGSFKGEPDPGKTYYMAHGHYVKYKSITENTLPSAKGNYALWNDITLTEDWTAPEGTTTICLNGYNFSLDGHTITIPKESKLTICDCYQPESKAIVELSGGQFIIEGTLKDVTCHGVTVTDKTAASETTETIDNTKDYTVTLTDKPEEIEVYVGETKLTEGQYTYNPETGTLTILKEAITGNVTIKVPTEQSGDNTGDNTGGNTGDNSGDNPEENPEENPKKKRYNLAPSYPTVLFDTNGGTPISPLTRAFGTAVNLPRYTTAKEGHTFTGWFLDKDCTVPARSFKLTGSVILYAGWLADTADLTPAAGE